MYVLPNGIADNLTVIDFGIRIDEPVFQDVDAQGGAVIYNNPIVLSNMTLTNPLSSPGDINNSFLMGQVGTDVHGQQFGSSTYKCNDSTASGITKVVTYSDSLHYVRSILLSDFLVLPTRVKGLRRKLQCLQDLHTYFATNQHLLRFVGGIRLEWRVQGSLVMPPPDADLLWVLNLINNSIGLQIHLCRIKPTDWLNAFGAAITAVNVAMPTLGVDGNRLSHRQLSNYSFLLNQIGVYTDRSSRRVSVFNYYLNLGRVNVFNALHSTLTLMKVASFEFSLAEGLDGRFLRLSSPCLFRKWDLRKRVNCF